MTVYYEAPEDVTDLVEEMISSNDRHKSLKNARIGVLMVDEAPESNGVSTMGKVRKVTDEQKVFTPFDFIVWFAQDIWDGLDLTQKCALIEHELCHMEFVGRAVIHPHDLEEFNYIIQKYGFWRPYSGGATEHAVQQHFSFAMSKGVVATFNPAMSKAVLEQA